MLAPKHWLCQCILECFCNFEIFSSVCAGVLGTFLIFSVVQGVLVTDTRSVLLQVQGGGVHDHSAREPGGEGPRSAAGGEERTDGPELLQQWRESLTRGGLLETPEKHPKHASRRSSSDQDPEEARSIPTRGRAEGQTDQRGSAATRPGPTTA